MSENGQAVATSEDDTISVWHVDGDGRPRLLKCADVGGVELSPDGRRLAATCGDLQVLTVWDLTTEKAETVSLPGSGVPFAFSPDGQSLASAFVGPHDALRTVVVWRLHTPTIIFRAY